MGSHYKDNSVTIHHRNIRNLAIETHKFLQGLFLLFLHEVFDERVCNYDLRNNNFIGRRRVNSLKYGTKLVSLLAQKISNILPKEIKDSKTFSTSKA